MVVKLIRLGKISFANVLPIYRFLNLNDLDINLVTGSPTYLNIAMQEGRLDISPISSWEYACNFDKYILLPELSVSMKGPVYSILLFSRFDSIQKLDGARVGLTAKSASSIILLKILFEKFYNIRPRYFSYDKRYFDHDSDFDAVLLIGNDAINFSHNVDDRVYVYDLGSQWYKYTRQGMTLAVWAIQKRLASDPKIESIYQRLLASKSEGLSRLDQIVSELLLGSNLNQNQTFWTRYFQALGYDFSKRELEWLNLYYDYACEMGLLQVRPKIELINFREISNLIL